jgi:NADH:ubiquinone oxidoreductase subunit D
VGGVCRDVPPDFPQTVAAFLNKLPPVLDEIELMLLRNKIFMDRTIGVGRLTAEECLSFGLTGPLLRAAGVPYDLRRTRPYLCYPELEFDVPLRASGDVYARFEVRLAEMRQSIRIVKQCLERLPDGPISAGDYKVTLPPKDLAYNDMASLIHHFKITMPGHGLRPPAGELYSATEAPNGELGFFIVSDGGGNPYKLRIRPPSFYNYGSFPKQVEGRLMSDVVSVLASLNIIAGELDR